MRNRLNRMRRFLIPTPPVLPFDHSPRSATLLIPRRLKWDTHKI